MHHYGAMKILVVAVLLTAVASRPKRKYGGAKSGSDSSSNGPSHTYPFLSTTKQGHEYPSFSSTTKGHTYPTYSTTKKGHEYPAQSTTKGHVYPAQSTTKKGRGYPRFSSTTKGHTYPAFSTTTATPRGASASSDGKSKKGSGKRKSDGRGKRVRDGGKNCCDCAYNAAMEFLRQLFMKQAEYVRLSQAGFLLPKDQQRFEAFFSSKVKFPYNGTRDAADYLENFVLANAFAFQQVSLRGRRGCPKGKTDRISVMTTELAFESNPNGFQPNGAYCKYTVFFKKGKPVKYGRLGSDGCKSVPLGTPM